MSTHDFKTCLTANIPVRTAQSAAGGSGLPAGVQSEEAFCERVHACLTFSCTNHVHARFINSCPPTGVPMRRRRLADRLHPKRRDRVRHTVRAAVYRDRAVAARRILRRERRQRRYWRVGHHTVRRRGDAECLRHAQHRVARVHHGRAPPDALIQLCAAWEQAAFPNAHTHPKLKQQQQLGRTTSA